MPSTTADARSKSAARVRIAGILVLVLGLCAAPVYYWRQTRVAEENLGEILSGYDKAMDREMRVQQGTFGIVHMQWSQALSRPGTGAFLIAAGAALAWRGLYYVADRVEEGDDIG
jgi:hypothetical protein